MTRTSAARSLTSSSISGPARLSVVDDLGAVPSDDLRILHWNIHSSHDPSGHANSNSAAVKLIVLPMPRLRTN